MVACARSVWYLPCHSHYPVYPDYVYNVSPFWSSPWVKHISCIAVYVILSIMCFSLFHHFVKSGYMICLRCTKLLKWYFKSHLDKQKAIGINAEIIDSDKRPWHHQSQYLMRFANSKVMFWDLQNFADGFLTFTQNQRRRLHDVDYLNRYLSILGYW